LKFPDLWDYVSPAAKGKPEILNRGLDVQGNAVVTVQVKKPTQLFMIPIERTSLPMSLEKEISHVR